MSALPEPCRVSVIIPTMAATRRSVMLRRAIDSVRSSSSNPIAIIVVVNGNQPDQAVCDWLKLQPDVQLEFAAEPSAPGARLIGRRLVRTEFFSTLDDDDEFLSGTTDQKLLALASDPLADLLVSNGYKTLNGVDCLCYENLQEVPSNPLRSLIKFNWLHNCNALYRSNSVGVEYFENYNAMTEWTWIAFRLAMDGKKISLLDVPTFRYNNSPDSLSKSQVYFKSSIPLLHRMLRCTPPVDIQELISEKIAQAHHHAADVAIKNGRRREAWVHHLRSLTRRGGLKFLGFTRHLFQ